jgi:hypothetical protein
MGIVEKWGIETCFGRLRDSSSHVGLYSIVKFLGSSAWFSLKSSQNSFVLIGFVFNIYRETTNHHYGDHCPGPFYNQHYLSEGVELFSLKPNGGKKQPDEEL